MSEHAKIRVADYLALRLEELGIDKLFGVPGNHLGPFLTAMEESTSIRWAGGTNEINMGYAVDGYARVKGVGAVGVTYGVGALSLINPISGAFVENVPVIVINAAPTYDQVLNFRHVGLLTSHMSPNELSNVNAYRQVTVDAQKIDSSTLAPAQIDCALTACLSLSQPVYLEVCENVWDELVERPDRPLRAERRVGNPVTTAAAVEAACERIRALGKPIFWQGHEVGRAGLQQAFLELIEKTGIPYCSTIMAKATLAEDHPRFHGVYNGMASEPAVWHAFHEVARCRVGIGAWSTSKNLGGTQSVGEDWIMAARDGVSVGSTYFPNVMLADFISGLGQELGIHAGPAPDYYAQGSEVSSPLVPLTFPTLDRGELLFRDKEAFQQRALDATLDPAAALTYDDLFVVVDQYLEARDNHASNFVVSDAGFSLLGSQSLTIKRQGAFHSQASWLSIGYSLGAAVGLQQARPEGDQGLVFVGDGSFQETAQAVSDLVRTGTRNVVFILNNEDFYGVEQMLVDACFFRGEGQPDGYNALHHWQYEKLADVFGGPGTPCHGRVVSTIGELRDLLECRDDPEGDLHTGTLLVTVRLDRGDYPKAIQYKVDAKQGHCGG